jgi:cytoskeletal protein RodZ
MIVGLIGVVLLIVGCGSSLGVDPTPTPFATMAAEENSATETQTPEPSEEPPTATEEPAEAATEKTEEEDTETPTVKPPNTATPLATEELPTSTPVPTATPTSAKQFAPSLEISEPQPIREGVSTPATAIPTAVPAFDQPKGTTNVLLLGSDAPVGDQGVKRTDTMIVVSINREDATASMVSLPRDLYVYIPGGTMNRLNSAVTLGGVNLLKQTILYNCHPL